MKALNKPNLIIITGEQGSGKSTYARKHYPHLTIIDEVTNRIQILGFFKMSNEIVVCCSPEVARTLLKEMENGINYQIITLKNFEVVQISGRGLIFHTPIEKTAKNLLTDGFIVAAEGDLHQQLAKAKSEVKRLKEAIQEQNKPKGWGLGKKRQAFL